MDPYNPEYQNVYDAEKILNRQNIRFGAQVWYPLLEKANYNPEFITPDSVLLELSQDEIKSLREGIVVDSLIEKAQPLLSKYRFVKTTHKSSHQFKPINNIEEFIEEMAHPDIIMSFRRYNCSHLFFRKYVDMKIECRVYVYKSKVRYMECYRNLIPFDPKEFKAIYEFVSKNVVDALSSEYDNFTADVYFDETENRWGVIEINSPLWLKAGVYLLDYERNRDLIHTTEIPICYYRLPGFNSGQQYIMDANM